MQNITGYDFNPCLTSLIGMQSDPCVSGTPPLFFVEQLDGIDLDKLSKISSSSDVNGKEYAKRIIQAAAAEMVGDLDLLIGQGYSLRDMVGETCSTCDFNGVYVAAGGLKVHNASLSKYSELRITKVNIKANATGDHQLKVDDGITAMLYDVTLEAGTVMPVLINYATTQKDVYLSLVDNTVGMAQIICPNNASCGCGGVKNSGLITYTGRIGAGADTSQYGFVVCANVGCSNKQLLCEMIRQAPNIFGLTLLYKIGEKINTGSKLTLRNNRVSAQPDEEKDNEIFKYAGLYRSRMNGSTQTKGIRQMISQYLNNKKGDSCIVCNSLVQIAYTSG